MTFNDIFKSSFLESITEFSAADTLIAMVEMCIRDRMQAMRLKHR